MAKGGSRGAQALSQAAALVLLLLLGGGPVEADEPRPAWGPLSAPWPTAYLVVGAIVLVLQSALIVGLLVHRAQRRRTQHALAEQLRFETLLSGLSATFVTVPVGDVGPAIESGLQRIVTELDIDRAVLAELGPRRELARVTYGWTRTGISPMPMSVNVSDFPWMSARLGQGHVVHFGSASDLPEDAITDRRSVAALGVRSLVAVPLVVGGVVVGSLACSSLRAERAWPEELVQRLRLIAEVFANALARRRAEGRIRESEERFRLMADGAPWMVWMSDPDARRTYFNSGWLDVTGRRLEDEVGEGWTAGVHPEDREGCLAMMRDAVGARRPFTLDYRLQRWDGEYRSILDHGLPRVGTERRRHRLHRLGHRRHGAEDRAAGAGREQRAAERHLRLALRSRGRARLPGRHRRGQRVLAALRRGERRRSCPRLGRGPLPRGLSACCRHGRRRRPPGRRGDHRGAGGQQRSRAPRVPVPHAAGRALVRDGGRAAAAPRARRGRVPRRRDAPPTRRGSGDPAARGAGPHAAGDDAGPAGDVAGPRGESAARRDRGERPGDAARPRRQPAAQPPGRRRRARDARGHRRRRQARLGDHPSAARRAAQGAHGLTGARRQRAGRERGQPAVARPRAQGHHGAA